MTDGTSPCLTKKEQYWLKHIDQANQCNQTLVAYAQEHSLNLKAFYNYRSKLRQKNQPETGDLKSFVKAKVSIGGESTKILIMLTNGIHIETHWQPNGLAALIKSLV